ncbi:unnamed protein product, partial [Protopolystoma xenopodis]
SSNRWQRKIQDDEGIANELGTDIEVILNSSIRYTRRKALDELVAELALRNDEMQLLITQTQRLTLDRDKLIEEVANTTAQL